MSNEEQKARYQDPKVDLSAVYRRSVHMHRPEVDRPATHRKMVMDQNPGMLPSTFIPRDIINYIDSDFEDEWDEEIRLTHGTHGSGARFLAVDENVIDDPARLAWMVAQKKHLIQSADYKPESDSFRSHSRELAPSALQLLSDSPPTLPPPPALPAPRAGAARSLIAPRHPAPPTSTKNPTLDPISVLAAAQATLGSESARQLRSRVVDDLRSLPPDQVSQKLQDPVVVDALAQARAAVHVASRSALDAASYQMSRVGARVATLTACTGLPFAANPARAAAAIAAVDFNVPASVISAIDLTAEACIPSDPCGMPLGASALAYRPGPRPRAMQAPRPCQEVAMPALPALMPLSARQDAAALHLNGFESAERAHDRLRTWQTRHGAWTATDENRFLEAFRVAPKQFDAIAAVLSRPVYDIVAHYYLSQANPPMKSALQMATNGWHENVENLVKRTRTRPARNTSGVSARDLVMSLLSSDQPLTMDDIVNTSAALIRATGVETVAPLPDARPAPSDERAIAAAAERLRGGRRLRAIEDPGDLRFAPLMAPKVINNPVFARHVRALPITRPMPMSKEDADDEVTAVIVNEREVLRAKASLVLDGGIFERLLEYVKSADDKRRR